MRSTPRESPRDPIQLTYLGVAGWKIEGAGRTILVDPYFSRPASLSGIIEPDLVAITKHAPAKADVIVIGHSHADHLLDAPTVALRTGAQLMGSDSTIRVGRATGVPDDHLIPIHGGEDYAFDDFSIRVIPSLHSALDDKHFLQGKVIADPVKLPMAFSAYEDGGTFMYLLRLAGHEILIASTANFIERELAGLRPDIAILAPGLREEIHDYTCRLMHALGDPPVVYATHFDNWREPPPEHPVYDEADFVAEVKACAPGTTVIVPRHFETMTRP